MNVTQNALTTALRVVIHVMNSFFRQVAKSGRIDDSTMFLKIRAKLNLVTFSDIFLTTYARFFEQWFFLNFKRVVNYA